MTQSMPIMILTDSCLFWLSCCIIILSYWVLSPCSAFWNKVIAARRKFSVSPPCTSGPAEFERVYRAQMNCTEYFPMFLAVLWLSGIFFHQGTAAACGLLYLLTRYRYFVGYSTSSQGRLVPMYLNAGVLWFMIALSTLGILNALISHYLGLEIL